MISNPPPILMNTDAIIAPTINDDESLGYERGSQWFDSTTNIWYICYDATIGNAVWNEFNDKVIHRSGYPITEDFVGALNGVDIQVSNSSTNGASISPTSQIAIPFHAGIRLLRTGTNTLTQSLCQDAQQIGQGAIKLDDEVTESTWKIRYNGRPTLLPTDSFDTLVGWVQGGGSIPPGLGIYFYYNPALYAGATQHFFRVIFRRSPIQLVKIINYEMPAIGTPYINFKITSLAGTNYPNRKFIFTISDDDNPTEITQEITENEIITAGITPPYLISDAFQISTGIQKPIGSIIQNQLRFDFVSIDKRNLLK